jgi:hypothetical protein
VRPTRRRVLRSLGATAAGVALSGCSFRTGENGDGTPTRTDTETPTGTPPGTATATETRTPTDESGAAVVYDTTVRPELVDTNTPDSYRVYGSRDTQWIVVEIVTEENGPAPDTFTVETPTATYETTTDVGGWSGILAGFGRAYGRGRIGRAGWLAARLPKPLDDERVALSWDGGRHEFDENLVRKLRRPPATFEASYRVSRVEAVEQAAVSTVTVRNTADVPGTFVAGIHYAGPLVMVGPRIAFQVPPDGTESTSRLHTIDDVFEDDYESVSLRLRWRGGDARREVEFVEGE